MPGYISVDHTNLNFRGIQSIYQYTNVDGTDPSTVCGLAACATLLTYCGFQPASIETLRKIEKSHPADLMFGKWGTSPWRIEAILNDYKANATHHLSSIDDLKRYVRMACPVICVIQNTEGVLGLGDGAHWFVVFAYDDDGVFVTNYDPVHLTWKDFMAKWDSVVPKLANLNFKGITNTSRIAADAYIARTDHHHGKWYRDNEVSWG
jgi:hypothetical protein